MNTLKATYPMNVIPADSSAASDYALPRGGYVFQIPGILTFVALIVLAMNTDLGMALAAATGTVVALYMLWDWLFRYGPTRIFHAFAINLLLGYGGGALNSYLTLGRAGSFASYWGTSGHVVAQGMASILLIGAVLCVLGELYEKPLLLPNFRIWITPRTNTFIYLSTGALIVAFYLHVLGFSGISNGDPNAQQNPIAALLSQSLSPLVAISVAAAIAAPKGYVKWSLIVCAVISAALQTTVARRSVFYVTLLILFTLRASGYRMQKNLLRNILLFGGIVAFAFGGIMFYMLLRLAGYQGKGKISSMPDRLSIVESWVADGSALQRAEEANGSNIKTRSFVLGFYADILEGSLNRAPAYGVNLISATISSVPRVFYPEKDSGYFDGIQLMAEEPLSDQLFGLTYTDAANSIITAGAIDFGLIGAFLFPLIMAYAIRKWLDFSSPYLDNFFYMFLVLASLALALPTEVALYNYFSSIRNLILIAVLLYIFQRMPKFAWTISPNGR